MKIITIILLTAIVTGYFTFTATKNYVANSEQLAHECVPVAQDIASPDLPTVIREPEVVAEMHEQKMAVDNAAKPLVTSHANIESAVNAHEEQRKQIEAFRNFVNAEHKKPLIEEASDRYHAEAVNVEWATRQESSLLSVFSNSEELRDYIPSQMSCRSSTCKIIIPVQDEAGANEAYSAAWRALSPMGNTVTHFSNPEKAETVLYVSQQGKGIF